jgi:hypothetical protein
MSIPAKATPDSKETNAAFPVARFHSMPIAMIAKLGPWNKIIWFGSNHIYFQIV